MAQTGASHRHKQRRKATPAHTKEGESEVTPERTADRGILGRTFRYNNCGVTRRCCECLERADLMRHCDSCGHCAEPSLPLPRGRPGWPPVSCLLPALPVCHLHNGVRQIMGELAATRRPHDRRRIAGVACVSVVMAGRRARSPPKHVPTTQKRCYTYMAHGTTPADWC